MKEIPLTQDKVALVDDEDFEVLSKYKWYYKRGYAMKTTYLDEGKRITEFMHRVILGIMNDLHTDHINNNGLDNRRSNLRKCTVSQNQMNRGIHKNNTSGYKGVMWHKLHKKWFSRIAINGKRYYMGEFKDKIDAARAYNEAALKYHGEFARINNIKVEL
jgi:hypothetical protein